MRKIKDVLRLKFEAGLSYRQISASTKLSLGKITDLVQKVEASAYPWQELLGMDEAPLLHLLYPGVVPDTRSGFVQPDWPTVHLELHRKGVTKQLLWEEYATAYPTRCYSYSQYCERYNRWLKKQKRSMRQTHRVGEKLFVDYCGQTVPIVDPITGECSDAQIFVAVLGASNYTYAEATRSQSLPHWLESHVRAFEFFGGTPEIVVPDNLKSGISKACRYDPDLNPAYQQLAEHYRVAVIPARPHKPKDKAKVEVGVQIVERWILARLRHQTFFSLAEFNQVIQNLLHELNHKPFKQLPGNRQEWFDQLERGALRALPIKPYTYTDIKPVKVNIDYHVEYKQHHYSVPHQLVGERLEIHAGERLVEIYFQNRRVATHPRKHTTGMTTQPDHMPTAHKKHQQWTPGRLLHWAQSIGPETLLWVQQCLACKAHPEQAYRTCLGLLNLSRSYPAGRLDRACQIANREGLTRLKQIKAILQSNQDALPEQPTSFQLPQTHDNIRGPQSFH